MAPVHEITVGQSEKSASASESQLTTELSKDESEQELLDNPFADPREAERWREVYERAGYECRHVFDPQLQWSPAEEKRLVRKLDWHVATWACCMFFALNLDRGNIKQAISDNMLEQLHLTTNDYNYGQTVFYISFLLAELPSQLVSKKIGPDRWIPTQMVLWSIVAAAQAGLTGKTNFLITRALLGVLEGGFIPDLILWLSYFYKGGELSVRLSFFWISSSITVIIAYFLAFGLLHLDGVQGLAGWRWMFLVEGLITLSLGFASFFLMPASAVQTKTWFRPKGWFTEREEAIVVNRVLRDDKTKGDMHNRAGLSLSGVWDALCDYDLWPLYLIGLIVYIPQNPPATYLTLSLRNLGFNPFQTNLLSIPAQAFFCFTLYGITKLSVKLNERSLVSLIQNVWLLPCLLALRFWGGANLPSHAWGTYSLLTVLLSYPYCHAIIVSWASKNSGSVRMRVVSAALYNMMVQTGNIVASNIYRTADKPLYHRGNSALIGVDILAILLFIGTKFYYIARNRYKARKWQALTEVEREDYLRTTKDEGNKRLDFVFSH